MFNDSKDKNINQSRVLESKGDKALQKDQDSKAFEFYKKALDLDENRLELYDKIIELHSKYSEDWGEDDFAYNVHMTMKKQEIMDPTFKRTNARLTDEFKEVMELIKKMFAAKERNQETEIVEKIATYEMSAIYPLVDFILGFKEVSKQVKEKREAKEKEEAESKENQDQENQDKKE